MFSATITDYFNNSSFHGFRFLSEPGRHWMERIFWLVCILGSWYLCFILMVASYNSYLNNAISFGTETDYINWNTSFFTIAVCESRNRPPVYDLGQSLYGPNHDFNLDEVLLEIAYFKGDHYFMKNFCGTGPKPLNCPKVGFREISDQVRTNCSGIFFRCVWNDTSDNPSYHFDCCNYFQPLNTEKGICYALNSLMVEKPNRKLDLTCNKYTGPGKLSLQLKVPADVFILAPEEVPFHNAHVQTVVTAQRGIHKFRQFAITEIVNGEAVTSVGIDQRLCRFKEENILKSHKYYSYMACVVECRVQRQIELCGCVSHLSPGVDQSMFCNLTGLLCLVNKVDMYTVLINPWASSRGMACEICLPSCTEPEIDLVADADVGFSPNPFNVSKVEISLQRLPTLRLKRTVVKGLLDLVVSMGGSAGLFVGASLLSFVELIYFFTIRPWWNARVNRNLSKPDN